MIFFTDQGKILRVLIKSKGVFVIVIQVVTVVMMHPEETILL